LSLAQSYASAGAVAELERIGEQVTSVATRARPLSALWRLPFFAGKFLRDLTRPLRYVCNTDEVHGARLGRYYLEFDEQELMRGGSQNFHFDAHGIPIIPTYIDVEPRQMHYYPISIGQYALAIFHTWLRSSRDEDLWRFLCLANWFLEHQAEDGCWYASVEVPTYRLRPPWASAMAQGRVLSVLTRAWQCTAEEKYIASAQRGLAAFSLPIARGGVVDAYDGWTTYEEYPAYPAPHVLNGMIFALFGLWDMIRVQANARAAEIFERGAATVEGLLPLYDTGWWSLYDLYHLEVPTPRNPATAHYHDIHIKQLNVMHAITGREPFAHFAHRWTGYQDGWGGRMRAYAAKSALIARRKLA
jgi:heparosan-N-sulfate-glucuronate 5-epimerase